MVTHSSTSRPVQCLCMAERTGCPVLTDLWSYVLSAAIDHFMYCKIVVLLSTTMPEANRAGRRSSRNASRLAVHAGSMLVQQDVYISPCMVLSATSVNRQNPPASKMLPNYGMQILSISMGPKLVSGGISNFSLS
jgi:hypothetical protein